MIVFKAKSLGLSVARARLAGTPSRIQTAATMTWRMRLPARWRSLSSADTTRACAGCRAPTATAAPRGSAPVFKPSSTAGAASDYDGILRALAGAQAVVIQRLFDPHRTTLFELATKYRMALMSVSSRLQRRQ